MKNNQLNDWHEIIRKTGDQTELENEERFRRLKKELPKAIRLLKRKSNKDLLKTYREFPSGGLWAPKKEIKVRETYIKAIEKEILSRMSAGSL